MTEPSALLRVPRLETGETDEEGYPVRRDWSVNYRGPAADIFVSEMDVRNMNDRENETLLLPV
jgi:hypothetical protein